MDTRAITSIVFVSGLSVALFAGSPIRAEDPKPAEPPKVDPAEPKGGGESPGKSDQEMLKELLDRREKARLEMHLLEAQLAVKKAEVQRADAEVRVFRLQHPDTLDDEKAFRDWVNQDPEVAELQEQINKIKGQLEGISRRVRTESDPSRMHVIRTLESLEQKLKGHIESRKELYIQRVMPERLSGASRGAGAPGEIERTLDRLIGELENLKRALLRDNREP